jgi:hypothetical protein
MAHALLDRAIDRWVPVLEALDGAIERLEAEVLETAGTPRGKETLTRLLGFKRTLWDLRRTGVRQRETLFRLSCEEFAQIPSEVLPFFRDIHDHFLQLADMAAGYPERASGAFDAYVSVQGARMNEVMKTLTLIWMRAEAVGRWRPGSLRRQPVPKSFSTRVLRLTPKWRATSSRTAASVPIRREACAGIVTWWSPAVRVVSRRWLPVCLVIS